MKVWLVQMEAKLYDKESNARKIVDYVNRAADAGADVVAFPELVLTGYLCREKFFDLAEPIPGPSTTAIMDTAKKRNIYVVMGAPEVRGSFMYNSVPLFGPEGLVGIWRKTNLATAWSPWCIYDEGFYFKPGKNIEPFDTRFGKLGIQICRDNFYPEIARAQAYRGALVIITPVAAPCPVGGSIIGAYPEERFHIIGKARSLENCLWFCCVNFGGKQDGTAYSGASVIIDNTGHIQKVASTGPESHEEVLEYDIDLERAAKERVGSFFLKTTNPETLRKLADIVSET